MEIVKGYKNVSYMDLQQALHIAYTNSKKSEVTVATEIKVDSTNTVRNAFNTTEQKVSDKVLTNVCKSVGLNGFVLWQDGQRNYFLKSK